jgi:hypothetical protein
MIDPTDKLIESAVACRENGMAIEVCFSIIGDVYAAPWSHASEPRGIPDDELDIVPPTMPVPIRRRA